jgi:hypothetical protein
MQKLKSVFFRSFAGRNIWLKRHGMNPMGVILDLFSTSPSLPTFSPRLIHSMSSLLIRIKSHMMFV